MIRTTVAVDLIGEPARCLKVQPRGHRSTTAQPHIELTYGKDLTVAIDVEGAQQLALDLVEALALIRKPRTVAQDGAA